MNTEELLNALCEAGYFIHVSPSMHGDGLDLQINNRDDEMVHHEPLCACIRPGLLDLYSRIETGKLKNENRTAYEDVTYEYNDEFYLD